MKLIDHYTPHLDNELRNRVPPADTSPNLLYGMLRYHLGWADHNFQPASIDSGKRVRPTILLLATEAQGGDWQAALPAAAAVELLHNFTLIHDDIEDRDEMRRGRPTLWSLWGIAQAINAGDALFAISFRSLLALNQQALSAERILTALTRYTDVIVQVTEGQCRDISFESLSEVAEADYLGMIEGKTAALLGLAAELGAILAGAPARQSQGLRDFGKALGKAFQMYDDLLGLWGDPAKTGKPVGSDLLKKKKTLPILHGMQHSPALRQLLIDPAFGAEHIPMALSTLETVGSRAHTLARAETFHCQALEALAASGGTGEAQTALHALAEGLLHRQK